MSKNGTYVLSPCVAKFFSRINENQSTFINLWDLEIDKEYEIRNFEIFSGKNGNQMVVSVFLPNKNALLVLPERFARYARGLCLEDINMELYAKYYLIYHGSKEYPDMDSFHDITLTYRFTDKCIEC